MEDSIKKRLSGQNNVTSVNGNVFTNVNLLHTHKELPIEELNAVVDEGGVFNEERQKSKTYRFISTLIPNVQNPLFNLKSDSTSYGWDVFNEDLFLESETFSGGDRIKYDQVVSRFLSNKNGWFGFTESTINPKNDTNRTAGVFYEMTPTKNDLYIQKDNGELNWDIRLTIPTKSEVPTNSIVDNGLLIISSENISVGGVDLLLLQTPVKHNLSVGSTIKISGLSDLSKNGKYLVEKIGNNQGDSPEYYFAINVYTTSPLVGVNTRIKRVVNGIDSKYYFRKFTTVDSNSPGEVYRLPLLKQLYNDKGYQIAFDDLDVSTYVDNLGRPISEVYVSIFKRTDTVFTPLKSGLDVPFTFNLNERVPDIHRISESPDSYDPLEADITVNDEEYFGDVAEFNELEQTEYILSDIHYSFNTKDRIKEYKVGIDLEEALFINESGEQSKTLSKLGPRYEGYYYKPHHMIKIRQFSSYVEEGDETIGNVPSYATKLDDGRLLWKDLLDIGFSDKQEEILDYPFLNGCHYIHSLVCINLRRQDPFDNYGLYYSNYPADPFGGYFNVVDIEVKRDDNC